MALKVELKDNKFRVQRQEFATTWMADTLANRKAIVVFLRNLTVNDRPMFSLAELSVLFGGKASQVTNCTKRFEYSGRNFIEMLNYESKVLQKWELEERDNKFRFVSQELSTEWFINSIANKKVMAVVLNSISDSRGRLVFKHKELCKLFCDTTTSAVASYVKSFRDSGGDFELFLTRKKKVNKQFVATVSDVVKEDPLLTLDKILEKTKQKLSKEDISRQSILSALEQVSYQVVRRKLLKLLTKKEVSWKQQELIDTLFHHAQENKTAKIPATIKQVKTETTKPKNSFSDSKGQKKLQKAKEIFCSKPEQNELAAMWEKPVGWQILAFLLYLNGVSTSVIGNWFGVNKSTISRWLDSVSFWGCWYINELKIAYSGIVAVDEKWIKVGNVWWYLFAAVDHLTDHPIHTAIYPSNDKDYCKLFLLELKTKGYCPKIIITDGWKGYVDAIKSTFKNTEHLYCRFHAIQSLFHRLKKAKVFDNEIFSLAGKIFQSRYKRTVKRRFSRLESDLQQINKTKALKGIQKKLEKLIKAVGSTFRPSTANSVERFFGAFDRLYKLKGPFANKKTAEKHLHLFMLGYMFKIGSKGQPCPLEKTGINVGNIPFYHLLNRPNLLLLKQRMQQQHLLAG